MYRDRLRRTASASAVDIEGTAVWVQEYLRYRVNRCGHVAAQDQVLSQINGQGIAAICISDLSGTWRGTSNYFNAPFVMDLSQTGTRVSGSYRDQHDRGSVSGTIVGDIVALRVELGGTGHLLDGRWDRADIVNGDFRAGGGAGQHSFAMRRQ